MIIDVASKAFWACAGSWPAHRPLPKSSHRLPTARVVRDQTYDQTVHRSLHSAVA